MDELVDHLAEAFGAVDEVVAGLDHAGTDAALPGWTAADLVAHLIDGQLRTAVLVRGAPGAAAPVERTALPCTSSGTTVPFVRARDALGALRASSYDVLAALGEPWVLTRTFRVPGGSTPGIAAGRLLLREALAHGRDLAATTGRTLRVRERIVALALDAVPDAPVPSVLPPGPRGPVATDGPPLARVRPACRPS